MNNRNLLTLAVVCIAFFIGTIWEFPYKGLMRNLFQTEYGEHVFKCDNAMREHFIAKSKAAEDTSLQSINGLQAAEVALVDCHEYDKFRKKLISYGLDDNDLAIMGLQSIEEKKSDLSKLVREHEIRY